MVEVDYDGKILEIDDVRRELDRPIGEVVVADDVVIVRFERSRETDQDVDVVGYNLDGSKRWNIDDPDYEGSRESVFKTLRESDGELLLKNWNSFEYRLDPSDGSVEQVGKWDR